MDEFDEWWNADYDDSENPFEKDSFVYWAYAGWCAALAQSEQEPVAVEQRIAEAEAKLKERNT